MKTTLIATLLIPSILARAEPVDRILATVNYEVITASDLAHAVGLNARLGGGDPEKIESETLEGLITRSLLVQEARRLRFVEITDREISDERDKLVKRFGSDKALSDFLSQQDMGPQELNKMLGERLLVGRFIEKKVGLFVRVSREEAQRYFDEHAAEFKGKRFPDAQNALYSLLTNKKLTLQIAQYVAEVRSKTDIRINAQ